MHCAGGVRSAIAYGVLRRKGLEVINIVDGFKGMISTGLKNLKKFK